MSDFEAISPGDLEIPDPPPARNDNDEEPVTRAPGCCWRMITSPGGLLLLLSLYCVFGALLFSCLEGHGVLFTKSKTAKINYLLPDMQKPREDCLKELWAITGNYSNKLCESFA